jgi:hypothetical protein
VKKKLLLIDVGNFFNLSAPYTNGLKDCELDSQCIAFAPSTPGFAVLFQTGWATLTPGFEFW